MINLFDFVSVVIIDNMISKYFTVILLFRELIIGKINLVEGRPPRLIYISWSRVLSCFDDIGGRDQVEKRKEERGFVWSNGDDPV